MNLETIDTLLYDFNRGTKDASMNKNKRLTLKMTALSGAFLSSPSWFKPAVNAIALPAHAQTSALAGTLTLMDSFSITTGANDQSVTTCYQVDDRLASGVSEPSLVMVPNQNNDMTICVSFVSFFTSGVVTETDNFVDFIVGSTTRGHSISRFDNTAQDPDSTPRVTFSGVPASVTIEFLSVTGNPWELTYSVSQDGAEAFVVSDVILSSV